MKLFIHISYKLEVQHSVLYSDIWFYHISYRTIYRSFNRAMTIHVSNQNAFHSAVNFIFCGNTYLYAKHASPTRDKGQQRNEKHSELWSCPWQLFLYIYFTHSGVQMLQELCWLSAVLKHKKVRCGLPKLPGGQASSVHAAETKSQHRSTTEEWMAPCVSCKTHRSWTFRHWTQSWAYGFLNSTCFFLSVETG